MCVCVCVCVCVCACVYLTLPYHVLCTVPQSRHPTPLHVTLTFTSSATSLPAERQLRRSNEIIISHHHLFLQYYLSLRRFKKRLTLQTWACCVFITQMNDWLLVSKTTRKRMRKMQLPNGFVSVTSLVFVVLGEFAVLISSNSVL